MAYDEETAWVIWPEYFDSRRSRSEGRRVNKRLAVENPTLEGISKALDKLGLEYELNEEKAHPANWYHKKGMAMVENSLSKTELLRKIAEKIPR
ncbi:MAG: signal recognition particle subunit SRP19/SEC65 family protein [Methanomassiliicoccales archaeon]